MWSRLRVLRPRCAVLYQAMQLECGKGQILSRGAKCVRKGFFCKSATIVNLPRASFSSVKESRSRWSQEKMHPPNVQWPARDLHRVRSASSRVYDHFFSIRIHKSKNQTLSQVSAGYPICFYIIRSTSNCPTSIRFDRYFGLVGLYNIYVSPDKV